MNTRMSSSNLGVTATVVGSSVQFTSQTAGTGSAFSVTQNGVAATRTVTGADVQGAIDGYPATGSGSILSLVNDSSGANGLGFDTSALSPSDLAAAVGGHVGEISYKPGFASSLANLLDNVTDATDGTIARAQQSRLKDVKGLQDSIDSWDLRLASRRQTLTRQFTAMETAIAALKSQTSALSGLAS
jgi:flagellar hook-associated protein 2